MSLRVSSGKTQDSLHCTTLSSGAPGLGLWTAVQCGELLLQGGPQQHTSSPSLDDPPQATMTMTTCDPKGACGGSTGEMCREGGGLLDSCGLANPRDRLDSPRAYIWSLGL